MLIKIIDCLENYILIEYEDPNIQRKLIPKTLYTTSIKGQLVDIPKHLLNYSLEYSDVDLVSVLGIKLTDTIQTSGLEDRLKRAGLWRREDYLIYPNIVTDICVSLGIDTPTILNAAQSEMEIK